MKTSKRSLEGSNGLSAGVRLGRWPVAPNSLTTTSRRAFPLAPFCEQSGPASARAAREFVQTTETRQGAIPSPREDCCHGEAVMPHYPVEMHFGVSRDDHVAYETGPPRPALT
jgi:hypothetical protein